MLYKLVNYRRSTWDLRGVLEGGRNRASPQQNIISLLLLYKNIRKDVIEWWRCIREYMLKLICISTGG